MVICEVSAGIGWRNTGLSAYASNCIFAATHSFTRGLNVMFAALFIYAARGVVNWGVIMTSQNMAERVPSSNPEFELDTETNKRSTWQAPTHTQASHA